MPTATEQTFARIDEIRARIAAAADDLYAIDRDTLITADENEADWIALIGAANDIRKAERALGNITRAPTEYRNEYGDITTDEAVADGWSDAAMEVDSRDVGADEADWRPWNYEGTEAVTADRIAHYAAREAALEG